MEQLDNFGENYIEDEYLSANEELAEIDLDNPEKNLGSQGLAPRKGSPKLQSVEKMYIEDIKAVPRLAPDEEQQLLLRMEAARGDESRKEEFQMLRNKLVSSNMRLVAAIAMKKFMNQGMELVDLISEGFQGLVAAANKYESSRGVKFGTYSYKWIILYMELAIQKNSYSAVIPAWIDAKMKQSYRARCALAAERGCDPGEVTPEEIASIIEGVTPEMVRYMDEIFTRKISVNMDQATKKSREDDKENQELPDINGKDVVRERILRDRRASLIKLIDMIPKEYYREVLKMRYGLVTGEPMTLEDIGKYYGSVRGLDKPISREAIRQIEEKAIKFLREDQGCQNKMAELGLTKECCL